MSLSILPFFKIFFKTFNNLINFYRASNNMEPPENSVDKERTQINREYIYILVKLIILFIVWAFITILFMITTPSKKVEIVVPLEDNKEFNVEMENPTGNTVRVQLVGNVNEPKTYHPNLASPGDPNVIVNVEFYDKKDEIIWKSKDWVVYYGDSVDKVFKNFDLTTYDSESDDDDDVRSRVKFINHHDMTDGFSIKIVANPCDTSKGIYFQFPSQP